MYVRTRRGEQRASRPEIDKQFARLGSEAAFKDKANTQSSENAAHRAAHSLAAPRSSCQCTRQCNHPTTPDQHNIHPVEGEVHVPDGRLWGV
ncbi:hypothetical protein MTP99_016016 [Tenebrio molitor]|jgi:hypothetical protein|nr:hypothetical protein MTP99_016016 [Tenebrio molitor]